jgi:hypothetical protein
MFLHNKFIASAKKESIMIPSFSLPSFGSTALYRL